ncbi:MAG TPA: cation diffusion facilitator family transporter [Kiloniellales bacterium]|nr:cation diffusion facilitator family transporter [Kiloniellales bacterium]
MGSLRIEPEALKQERTLGLNILLDICIFLPHVYVGIASASWTIIADFLRGGLLITISIVAYLTLRRIHRQRLSVYDYGAGKLERSIAILIATLLLLISGMLLWRVSGLMPQARPPLYLAGFAIVLVVINFLANCFQLWTLYRAMRQSGSLIVRAQYQARWVMTIASVFVVTAVSVSMISSDAELARRADQLGTLTVIVIMVWSAINMLRECLPDLLDHSLPESFQHAINRVLARNIDAFEQLGRIRTRRAGSVMHVELELFLDQGKSLGQASHLAEQMQRELAEEIPGVDAVVVLRALAEGQPS